MISLTRTFRRAIGRSVDTPVAVTRAPSRPGVLETPPIDIAPNDPILAYFHAGSGAVPIDELQLDSPAVRALRSGGVKLVVPLISQGELIGLLNLGRRLSDQDYSTDDRRLLEKLAAQASPAAVTQLESKFRRVQGDRRYYAGESMPDADSAAPSRRQRVATAPGRTIDTSRRI